MYKVYNFVTDKIAKDDIKNIEKYLSEKFCNILDYTFEEYLRTDIEYFLSEEQTTGGVSIPSVFLRISSKFKLTRNLCQVDTLGR